MTLTPARVRAACLRAQRLDTEAPFGAGTEATRAATLHLGYVQIDTINVIERSHHHHILFTRILQYAPADLERAQSGDKSVFEYWTHALSYVAAEDWRFFASAMQRHRATPDFAQVNPDDYAAMLKRIRREGPLTIRDIDDEVLVEKTHPWASRKPSRRVLRAGVELTHIPYRGSAPAMKSPPGSACWRRRARRRRSSLSSMRASARR